MTDTITKTFDVDVEKYAKKKINLYSLVDESESIEQYTTHYTLDYSTTETLSQKQISHAKGMQKLPYELTDETVLSLTTEDNKYWYLINNNRFDIVSKKEAEKRLSEKTIVNKSLQRGLIRQDSDIKSTMRSSLKKYWVDSKYMTATIYTSSVPLRFQFQIGEVAVDDIVSGHSGDNIKKITGHVDNLQYNCLVRSADSFDVSKISENMFLKFDWNTYFFVEAVKDDCVVLTPVSKQTMSEMKNESWSLPDNERSVEQMLQMLQELPETDYLEHKYFSSF